MKFCSIVPLKNARIMFENDFVMLLAHLSKNDENYAVYAKNKDNYKIMDNSIIELGSAFSMKELVAEAIKCDVDEIILPDVFERGEETVEAVKNSIAWLRENNLIGKFKLMAVCHGRDLVEFNDTFKKLDNIKEIDVIGIPKVLSTWMPSRVLIAEYYTNKTNKPLHLLGCWYSLTELKELSPSTKIRSMDTCMPALLSIYDMKTFDNRQGKTIDLEKDEINLKKYNEIMNEIKEYL